MTEERVIKSIIKKIQFPKDIKSVDFLFSDDSTGMPAVWINLHVAEDYKPSDAKVEMLSALKKDISKKIFEKNVASWPYIRLVTS